MLLNLVLPMLENRAGRVRIDAVDTAPGDALQAGARLLEFTAGLDDAVMHDCPPLTTYRMTLSEKAWLRELKVAAGADVATGDVLAVLSTTPDEALGGEPERRARVAIAAILKPMAW